jgi:hypothetical protein
VTPGLAPLARFLLWDYGRGSVPYDVLVAVLFLLLIGVPAGWWGDPMVAGR